MALYGVSLDNATAPGVGTAIVFDVPKTIVTLVAVCNGVDPAYSSASTSVGLEFSVDGVNFTAAPGVAVGFTYVGTQSVTMTGRAVIAVRARIWRYDVGTTSVSASVAAA